MQFCTLDLTFSLAMVGHGWLAIVLDIVVSSKFYINHAGHLIIAQKLVDGAVNKGQGLGISLSCNDHNPQILS